MDVVVREVPAASCAGGSGELISAAEAHRPWRGVAAERVCHCVKWAARRDTIRKSRLRVQADVRLEDRWSLVAVQRSIGIQHMASG